MSPPERFLRNRCRTTVSKTVVLVLKREKEATTTGGNRSLWIENATAMTVFGVVATTESGRKCRVVCELHCHQGKNNTKDASSGVRAEYRWQGSPSRTMSITTLQEMK